MIEIICAGFGGQGVLTTGLILANVGVHADKQVTWIPSYGSEMRGGTANCHIKISDEEIASPYVKDIDVLLAMNDPSIDKFERQMKPGGVMIVNSTGLMERVYRNDIDVMMIPAGKIAAEAKNPKGLNITMLGAFIRTTELFDKEYFIEEVNLFFADKGRSNPLNTVVFEEGWRAVSR